MKVFQIFGSYPNDYQPYNTRLVEGLQQKSSQIQTYVVSSSPPKNGNYLNGVIYTYQSKFLPRTLQNIKGFFSYIKNEGFKLKAIKKASLYGKYRFILDNKAAVFHFHNLYSINNKLFNLLLKYKVKYVVSLRGYDVTIVPLMSEENA